MSNNPSLAGDPPQAGDPPVSTPQAGTTPTPEPQAGDGQETISLEEAKKLRSEAKALRDRLKAAEAKATELDKLKANQEQANLTENQRLQKQLTDLQTQVAERDAAAFEQVVENAVLKSATRLNFIDPDDAIALLDWGAIEIDETTGKPSNIEKLLADLVKAKPHLTQQVGARGQPGAGGATNPSRSQTQATTAQEIVDRLRSGRLSGEDYAKVPAHLRAEVQNLLRQR